MARRKSSSRRKGGSIWTILGLLLLLGAIYFAERQGWISSEGGTPARPPTASSGQRPTLQPNQPPPAGAPASGDAIGVYFTTPDLVYPDRAAQRQPPTVERAIIADIDAARSSIDMATFEYNLVSVAEALVRAKERGVAVRLALDRENLEKPEMADFAGQMERAQIPIAWEESDAFLHSKFIIVDQSLVWIGSWNATVNDTYRNNNNLLRITIPQIVQNYATEFEQMAAGRFGNKKEPATPNPRVVVGSTTIENYFSPEDGVRQHILEKLNAATSSIRFLAFSYTSDEIKDAMLAKQDAGLTVQGVFEARNAGGVGSEFELLREGGVDVLEDGNCYTMHHKVIIIDDHIVITGSYNFTARAEDVNDENLVIIDDPAIAQQFSAEFDRVYAQAREPTRCGS